MRKIEEKSENNLKHKKYFKLREEEKHINEKMITISS